jgi:hypothetical protein
MDHSHLREPVAHKLPLSDEVLKNLAVHHLARRIIVKCSGCPFDYALTVPEEIWFAGKADHYRESLLAYLKTTECGRHPSHIVWTHGSPIAVGQLRFATELGQLGETDLLAEQSQPACEEPLGKLSAGVDHVYLAVKCTGWACDNWIFLFDIGPAEAGKEGQRKLPRRFDVTCPACNSVLTYTRADLRQVRAQEPPGDWIDHPAFCSP